MGGATVLAAVLLWAAQFARAQGAGSLAPPPAQAAPAATAGSVDFALGVAGQPVAEAWNPVRLELRDVPPATLSIHIDQGTLRSGEVPLTITSEVRGGAGVALYEELIYLPRFATLSWRLATPERVLASGSLAGREADERPLDLVITSNPGAYRLPFLDAFGASARLVDLTASQLPQSAAAYDGVRSLIIDGTAAAPRLEAVAAAATGGTIVVLTGSLPASHSELGLLLGGAPTVRLGAGALVQVEGGRDAAVEALTQVEVPNRAALQAALVEEPLVVAPAPMKETTLVLLVAGYVALVLLLLRFGGTPGLSAAVALAALVSLVGWQFLRPAAPQLEAGAVLALAGGELATLLPVSEVLTMPRATLTFPASTRPFSPHSYWVDGNGAHFALDRWRTLLLVRSPQVAQAHLTVHDGVPTNVGAAPLRNLYLVGQGPQGDLLPGATTLQPSETGDSSWAAGLAPLLPPGTWLAQDECHGGCTTWVVYPPLELVAAADAAPGGIQPLTDPFRSTPAAQQEEL